MAKKNRNKGVRNQKEMIDELLGFKAKKSVPKKEAKSTINWYPGHMTKALREVKSKIKMVDIVIEVRDARLPLTSGNKALEKALGEKKRLIVFNKANLSEPLVNEHWHNWFSQQGVPFLFVNALDKISVAKILEMAKEITKNDKPTNLQKKFRLMFIGLPNTGKSTLINRISNRSAAKTANKPGKTRVQQWVKFGDTVELMDTPGIMPPYIDTDLEGYRLCAIHAIRDEIVGEAEIAFFLIKYLLKKMPQNIALRYAIENLSSDPYEVIDSIGVARNCLRQKGQIDLDRVYSIILQDFRKGDLGACSFETPPID